MGTASDMDFHVFFSHAKRFIAQRVQQTGAQKVHKRLIKGVMLILRVFNTISLQIFINTLSWHIKTQS
jgi:hypothetical protein